MDRDGEVELVTQPSSRQLTRLPCFERSSTSRLWRCTSCSSGNSVEHDTRIASEVPDVLFNRREARQRKVLLHELQLVG